jgi:hypothetical protein
MQDGERRRRRIRGRRSGAQPPPAPAPPVEERTGESYARTAAIDDAPTAEAETAGRRDPVAHLEVMANIARREHAERWATHHPAHDERDSERGLRGLVGGGSSQGSVAAAMRARDAARPTDAEIARAEATLSIVHRGWVPRDPSPNPEAGR